MTKPSKSATLIALAALAVLGGAPPAVDAAQVFFIGVDDGTQAEFEQENGQLADYYWEDGDYTPLGGQNWTGGMEPWRTEADTDPEDGLGMPRAFTTGFTEIRVYFQLDPTEVGPTAQLSFAADMIAPRAHLGLESAHDLAFEINGNVFNETAGISTGLIEASFPADSVGAVAGPNLLTMRRTGGSIPWDLEGPDAPACCPTAAWIQFDYLTVESTVIPEPGVPVLAVVAIGLAALARRRRAC